MCQNKMLPRTGFEPVTYGLLLYSQLQSTALPTELSRVDALRSSSSWLCPAPHHQNLTFTWFNHKAELLVQDESPLPSHYLYHLNTLSTSSHSLSTLGA